MTGWEVARGISFRVTSKPEPQGSHRIGRRAGRPVVLHDNHDVLMAWRAAVGISARTAAASAGWQPITGPCEMAVTFFLRRPSSVSMRSRQVPSVKPDLSKLVRAVEDGIVEEGGGRIVEDDARIVRCDAEKVYADEGRAPGAVVTIRELRWVG